MWAGIVRCNFVVVDRLQKRPYSVTDGLGREFLSFPFYEAASQKPYFRSKSVIISSVICWVLRRSVCDRWHPANSKVWNSKTEKQVS